jgi:hypothetical protein
MTTTFVELFDNQMLSSSRHSFLHRYFLRLPLYLAFAVLYLFVQPLSGVASEMLVGYEYFVWERVATQFAAEQFAAGQFAAGEAFTLFLQAENMRFDATLGIAIRSEMFSGFRFLSEYSHHHTVANAVAETTTQALTSPSQTLGSEALALTMLPDSLAPKTAPRTSTSASVRRSSPTSTASTLTLSTTNSIQSSSSSIQSSSSSIQSSSSGSFNAANIPLLTEPVVNVNAFADSLGIRRSTVLGGLRGTGIGGIPYNTTQGYSFQAASEQISEKYGYPITTASPATTPRTATQRTAPSRTGTSRSDKNPISIGIRESLMGTSLRTGGQVYTLDEYLSGRNEYLRSAIQDSITNHYTFRKPLQSELMNILSQSANVSVPFPSNPLTTIFGKPELKLNANIELNVRLGVGYNASNLIVNSATGQGQVFPIFTQNVQTNISASLGDKVSINLDNNTQRQFEFDNVIRLAYEGEPDEIFRKIELGNVTLNSNSTFINGSQALFGGRLDLQFGPVFVKILAAGKRGQRKVASVKGGSVKQPILLRAYDYADNNFFIHRRHRGIWRQYAATAPELPGPARFGNVDSVSAMRVKEIEVWESTPYWSEYPVLTRQVRQRHHLSHEGRRN